jgi:hypothetical protein
MLYGPSRRTTFAFNSRRNCWPNDSFWLEDGGPRLPRPRLRRTRWHYCCPQISRCLLKALFDEELLAMIQLLEIPREQSRALPKKPPRRLLWVQGIARTYPPSGCSKFRGWKGKQLSQRDPPSSEYSTLVIVPDGSGRKLRTAHRNPRSGPPCACVRACMAGLCSVKPSEK